MSTATVAAGVGEMRSATTANGGLAVTTTPQVVQFPDGTVYYNLNARVVTTDGAMQVAKVPYLTIYKTTDLLATVANLTDYSQNAQDAAPLTLVTLSSIDTIANLNALYVGSHIPFRGVAVDITLANVNASVLTVKYRKTDNTWADITATDGTASAGASMGFAATANKQVTWTVPTDWKVASLADINDGALSPRGPQLYWTRWQWSAALDSTTTIAAMSALARSVLYGEFSAGQIFGESVTKDVGGWAGIEARMPATTGSLIVNVFAGQGRGFV